MKRVLGSDVNKRVFISSESDLDEFNEGLHKVLSSAFTLELIFAFLHPRALCAAVRVNRTWYAVAYGQRTLWRDWDVEACLTSAQPRALLDARFGRLRRMVVPVSFVKSHGTPTHCAACLKPFAIAGYRLPFVCCCVAPAVVTPREEIKSFFRGQFPELQALTLTIPPTHFIPSFSLSHLTSLTSLSLTNLNPACAQAYGALVTQSPHLRALTYLTRPWEAVSGFPFSFARVSLERLEVNQIDFEEIVHMASSLKSLKVTGYAPIDKYTRQVCIRSIESLPQFSELENLDISGVDPSEVANRALVATHVCMMSNLQNLNVGPLFLTNNFATMARDMLSLRAVGISNNPIFSPTDLHDFSTTHFSSTLTSLYLRNCIGALADPGSLVSCVALRNLHIEQDPPHGGTLRKLVPTIVQMTQLVDLALVGLSINPVTIYPKLTRLQRLVLNHTPTSDADVLIMSKKLPALRHLGLLGCYHVTLHGLLMLLAVMPLRVLEWDEPAHTRCLVAACPELCVTAPHPQEPLEPIIGLRRGI